MYLPLRVARHVSEPEQVYSVLKIGTTRSRVISMVIPPFGYVVPSTACALYIYLECRTAFRLVMILYHHAHASILFVFEISLQCAVPEILRMLACVRRSIWRSAGGRVRYWCLTAAELLHHARLARCGITTSRKLFFTVRLGIGSQI